MKIKKVLRGMAFFALTAFFFGCSDLLQTKTTSFEKKEAETGSFLISLNSSARYIPACDYDITSVTDWTVTFTETGVEGSEPIVLNTANTADASATSRPSIDYDVGTEIFKASHIPVGSYNLTVEGSYTEGTNTVSLYGEKEGITVSEDASYNSAKVLVGLKKDKSKVGSLDLGFTVVGDYADLLSSVVVTLTNIEATQTYSTEGDNPVLTFSNEATGSTPAEETSTVYTLKSNATGIEPGWYRLGFKLDGKTIKIPSDKMMVEIAEGLTTSATGIEITVLKEKSYYATNDTSAVSKNGLAASSRKNLNALLEKLAADFPDVDMVNIYVDDVPEANVAALNSLSAALAKNTSERQVYIYSRGDVASITFYADFSEGATVPVKIGIEGSATITGSEEATVLGVYSITVNNDSAVEDFITLKNGASLELTGGYFRGGTLAIRAVRDEDGGLVDNFTAYLTNPIFKASTDYSDQITLYKSDNTEATAADYSLVFTIDDTKCYSYYVKPASIKGLSFVTATKDLQIAAYYTITDESGSKKIGFSDPDPIPYDNADLSFTITGLDGIENYYWYLNGKSLAVDTTKETAVFTFNPHETDVDVDGINTVSCFVSSGGVLYLKEYSFNFAKPSASAAVWMNNVVQDAVFYQVGDFDEGTPLTIGSDEKSDFYTFDEECNLWTVATGSAESTLQVSCYEFLLSAGQYTTSNKNTIDGITGVSGTLKDVCYDVKNGALYVLTKSDTDNSYYIGKISRKDFSSNVGTSEVLSASVTTVSLTEGLNYSLTQLAVYGDTFYFADSACNVYKKTISSFTGDSANPVPLSDPVKNLADNELLAGYDANMYDNAKYDSSSYDSLSITDLQVGDGLGHNNNTLYVLIREYTEQIGGKSDGDNFFSRGALVKINTDGDLIPDGYGWSNNESVKNIVDESYSYSINDLVYCPSSDSIDKFFGPVKFCALAPKKLVVLDDGFYWNEGEGTFNNRDSIFEFDIEAETLSKKNVSVSVSVPGTTDYYSGKTDW
ncbi:hypothetical protein [uncultured Treponema sp.]|uniref:hypothetical protein n=1 Tax=uncultured Treponema sp. TaxID=162155 RepID=UPI0015BB0CD2|nr:hypothetical protein [uncultured Treponema sp.]